MSELTKVTGTPGYYGSVVASRQAKVTTSGNLQDFLTQKYSLWFVPQQTMYHADLIDLSRVGENKGRCCRATELLNVVTLQVLAPLDDIHRNFVRSTQRMKIVGPET